MLFTPRTKQVHAVRWTGSNFDEVCDLYPGFPFSREHTRPNLLRVPTSNGEVWASPGQWIVLGQGGKPHVWFNEAFRAAYFVTDGADTPHVGA